jgi:flagellar biosynthesis/type III secretory pathway chaperone
MDQVENLCELLDQEVRVCGALSGLLREEQQAVVGLRAEAIVACLDQRQRLQAELERLASERRALVSQVAGTRGGATDRLTEVLPLLEPAPRERLRGGLRGLRRALLEARSLEQQNALLIGSSLDAVGDLLRALRALVPGARYNRDAQVAAPSGAESLDRRV